MVSFCDHSLLCHSFDELLFRAVIILKGTGRCDIALHGSVCVSWGGAGGRGGEGDVGRFNSFRILKLATNHSIVCATNESRR